MADDVKLKIGGDTSELEKALSNAIKKIQAEADKLKLTPTGAKAAPGVDSLREAAQTSRATQQRVREEKAGLDLINRELAKKKAMVEEIAKQQASAVKASREELALAERLTKEREKLQRAERIAQIQRENLRKAEESSRRATGGGGGGISGGPGGFNVPSGGITSLSSLAGAFGLPIGLIATVLAGSAAMGRGRQFFNEAGSQTRLTEASAFNLQGQGGQRINSLLNGGAAQEFTFNQQRIEAGKIADQVMDSRLHDWTGWRMLSHPGESLFGRTLSEGGLGTQGTKDYYQKQRDKERAEIQQEQFEALKSGPGGAVRTAVANQYLNSYQQNLDFQRQTGLNLGSFRGAGGFLEGVQGAGFTGEQGMGAASGILGAGGSTRGAVGNAALALQAGRNLDLTNSSSVLGKLSGSMGGAGVSKEAFVKILAEGTRSGLDGSDFREENRKFIESAAQMVSTSGVTTSGGVEAILSQFGKFFGDRTNTGIQAGQNAFDIYRQSSMATTGPRGAMRAAGMLTDPVISKLGRDSREALFNMPIDQLTPDNPSVIAMANEARVTPEDLIKAQNRITSKSANLFKNSDIATQRLSSIKAKYGVQSAIGFQGPLSGKAYDEIADALGRSNLAQIKEHPELGQDQRTTSAYSEAVSRGDGRAQQQALEDAKKQQLSAGAGATGRPEDQTNQLQAEASRLSNQLFMSIKDSIVPAAEAAKVFATDINTLTEALKNAKTSSQINSAIQSFQSKNPGLIGNQPTAGSPNSGTR